MSLLNIFLLAIITMSSTISTFGKITPVSSLLSLKKLKILETVFHASLLTAHFEWWSEGQSATADIQSLVDGLEDMEAGLHGSYKTTFLTCGSHDEVAAERFDILQNSFEAPVVTAVVDHEQGYVCYMFYGEVSTVDRVSDSNWPLVLIPPVLKILSSTIKMVHKLESVHTSLDMPQTASLMPPLLNQIPNVISVKFAMPFLSAAALENELQHFISLLETERLTRAQQNDHIMSHQQATSILGLRSGAWKKILDRNLNSDVNCRLSDIASETQFYGDYFELKHTNIVVKECPRCLGCVVDIIDLMSRDGRIVSISAEFLPELSNYLANGIMQTGDATNAAFTAAGLTGAGEIVGVSDSGLDDYSCFFYDTSGKYASPRTTRTSMYSNSVESDRRKVIQYVSYADGVDSVAGHGTHVVGTLVGSSTNPDYSTANGIAPHSKVAFFDIQRGGAGFLSLPDVDAILKQQYNAGARVFSYSWGSVASSSYSQRAMQIDAFLNSNQDALVIFAAGNGGASGFKSLYSPCDAKNALCVGSIDSRDDISDQPENGNWQVSFFSSMGPTWDTDSRIKPDVVAPGFSIISAMGGDGNTHKSCGTVDMFGTSMAAPGIAGLALLTREYFATKWTKYCRSSYSCCKLFSPSGILIKTLLVHSGSAVTRYSSSEFNPKTTVQSFDLKSPPDTVQGFGKVTLADVLPLSKDSNRDLYFTDINVISNSIYKVDIVVESDDVPLKVTLAWYDISSPAGSLRSLLINNIDLSVVPPQGSTLIGNRGADTVNNVEQVVVNRPNEGTYTVFVKSSQLSGNRDQRVVLVVTCSGYATGELSRATRRHLMDKKLNRQLLDVTIDSHSSSSIPLYINEPLFPTSNISVVNLHSHTDHTYRKVISSYDDRREFKFNTILKPMDSLCFDSFDIEDSSARLYSVDMSLDGSSITGSAAFVLAAIITAPNGERLQIGGYKTFVDFNRVWQRSWPVSWTGLSVGSQSRYESTRIVNMAGTGTAVGTWGVCVQLLYDSWEATTYNGEITLQFKAVSASDVSGAHSMTEGEKGLAIVLSSVVALVFTAVVCLAVCRYTIKRYELGKEVQLSLDSNESRQLTNEETKNPFYAVIPQPSVFSVASSSSNRASFAPLALASKNQARYERTSSKDDASDVEEPKFSPSSVLKAIAVVSAAKATRTDSKASSEVVEELGVDP